MRRSELVTVPDFSPQPHAGKRTWASRAVSVSFWMSETTTSHDGYGTVTKVHDLGDVAVPDDDLCTVTGYARNTDAWIDFLRDRDVPVREHTIVGAGHLFRPQEWVELMNPERVALCQGCKRILYRIESAS